MINALLIGPEKAGFLDLEKVFKNNGVNIDWSETGSRALSMITDADFDVIVIDENLPDMTGLKLAAKLVKINPMLNCALISSLSAEDYHEQSEGLGLIMQLPPNPAEEDGKELLKKLDTILNLTKPINT